MAHESFKATMTIYEASVATTISYKEACEQGIAAVRKVNLLCREECLHAQLDAHYGDKLKCKDAQWTPHPGMGGKKKETEKDDSAPAAPPAADD